MVMMLVRTKDWRVAKEGGGRREKGGAIVRVVGILYGDDAGTNRGLEGGRGGRREKVGGRREERRGRGEEGGGE